MRTTSSQPRRRRPIRVYAGLGSLGASPSTHSASLVEGLKTYIAGYANAELAYTNLSERPAAERVDVSALRKSLDAWAGPIGRAKTELMRARAAFINGGYTRPSNPPAGTSIDTWELAMTINEPAALPLMGELEENRVAALTLIDAAIVKVSELQVAAGKRDKPLPHEPVHWIDWSSSIGNARTALGRAMDNFKRNLPDASKFAINTGFGLFGMMLAGVACLFMLGRSTR